MGRKASLTIEQAQQVIEDFVNGSTTHQLGIKFGVSRHVIRSVLTGETFLGLHRPDNIRALLLERQKAAARVSRATISHSDAQEIVDRFVSGEAPSQLADDYCLSKKHIRDILAGDCWRGINRPAEVFRLIERSKLASQFQVGWAAERHASFPLLTEEQQEILLGSLLGDGSFTVKRERENSYFVKYQCKKFQEYVRWHYDQLQPYSGSVYKTHTRKKIVSRDRGIILERELTSKRHNGFQFRTIAHPVFSDLREMWYPDGKKIVPTSIKLTPRAVAIWYCDDGTNNYEDRRASLFTLGFSCNEAEFLASELQRLGVNSRILTKTSPYDGGKQPYLSFTGQNYDALIRLVIPYVVCSCFDYKVKYREACPNTGRKKQVTEEIVDMVEALRNSGFTWNQVSAKLGIRGQTLRKYLKKRRVRHEDCRL